MGNPQRVDGNHEKIRAHTIEDASKRIKRRFRHFGYLITEASDTTTYLMEATDK